MKKILFTAALIGTLFSCTTKDTRTDNDLLAVAEYKMALPSTASTLGFDEVLTSNVNFEYISNETNALSAMNGLSKNASYTLLAPMDYAFAKAISTESFTIEDYMLEGTWNMTNITAALETQSPLQLTTVSGLEVRITKRNDKIYVTKDDREIELVFTDLETAENTLHVVSELW